MPTTKLVTRTNVRDLSPKGTNRARDYRRQLVSLDSIGYPAPPF